MLQRFQCLIFFLSVFLVGCQSTMEAFNEEPPEKLVEVVQTDPGINVEAALQQAGVKYTCKEIYVGRGSSENRRACFIKAPEPALYERLGVKASKLPIALLKDTGRTVLIVGELALSVVMAGSYIPGSL